MQLSSSNVGLFRGAGLLAALLGIGLILAGCLPGGGSTQSPAQGSGSAPSAAPKTLRVGMVTGQEPKEGIILFAGIGATRAEFQHVFHAGLTVYDAGGTLVPRLAQKVPTVSDGDWRVLPDGQMEITWKLRPNLKWHDGVPATSADFAFGLQAVQDREFPQVRSEAARLIPEVATPDPSTLVVRWKQPYFGGNVSGPEAIPALPRHLMGDPYDKGDKSAFYNSPLWTTQFVGLGPYRLGEWIEGTETNGLAFDDYVLGRPKIDRVIFRYVGDNNALVLGLLAGAYDMTASGNIAIPHILDIKKAWEPTGGGQTLLTHELGARAYFFQFRNPEAPWADVRVRRALGHMLDRQALAEALMGGLVAPADTPVGPNSSVYRLLEQRGLARYSFDPGQAQRLLADAGWTRAPGGALRSSTGQPFTIDMAFNDAPENVPEAQAVAGQWKEAGLADITFSPISNTAPSAVRNELRHTFTGIQGRPAKGDIRGLNFITSEVGTAENRYATANRGGYSSAEYDRIYDRALVTLDLGQREGLMADLLKLLADDAVMIPVYYDPDVMTGAFRKGIRGVIGGTAEQPMVYAWNIDEWAMD